MRCKPGWRLALPVLALLAGPTIDAPAAPAIDAPAIDAPAIDWAHATLVTVVEVEYRFVPNHLVFRRGLAYRLHVVNRGRELHELTAPAFFKTVRLHNPGALGPDHRQLVVDPGTEKDIYFIPKRAGRYDMRCADHDWAGMTGEITVK
ncbi:MAG TPA: hypothetical protein VMF05_02130 [Stellaceae bacterium]|nr:hypothetical protein [Stellaceae bacterium]